MDGDAEGHFITVEALMEKVEKKAKPAQEEEASAEATIEGEGVRGSRDRYLIWTFGYCIVLHNIGKWLPYRAATRVAGRQSSIHCTYVTRL